MKKLLAIILCLAMVLSVLCFTSCGAKKPPVKDTEKVQDSESVEDTEKNNDGENAETGLDSTQDEASAALKEFGKTKGYEITMKIKDAYGEEYEYVSGKKGDITWQMTGEEEGVAFAENDGGLTTYDYTADGWTLSMNMPGGDYETFASIYMYATNMYLFYANGYNDGLQKIGEGKIAGRDCTKYKYSASSFATDVELVSYVDKELGITLKWGYDMKVEDDQGSISMEVISFKTGNDVKVPELPDAGEEYTDLTGEMGWPDNSFTELVPQAPGTVAMSSLQGDTFTAVVSEVSEDDYNDYVTTLQDAGFDGEVNEEEKVFTGTNKDGVEVTVQFEEEQMGVQVIKPAEDAEEE